MSRKVKSIIFKLALSLFLLSVILFFMTEKNSAEMFVCIITAGIDLLVCILIFVSIRRGDKKDRQDK